MTMTADTYYLDVRRADGREESVDVTAQPWAQRGVIDQPKFWAKLVAANAAKGTTVLRWRKVEGTDAAARRALGEVEAVRNRARELDAIGGVMGAVQARAEADRLEAEYRRQYPEFAARRDALIAELDAIDADRRRAEYEASFVARGID